MSMVIFPGIMFGQFSTQVYSYDGWLNIIKVNIIFIEKYLVAKSILFQNK
jgi:hypothetical protein